MNLKGIIAAIDKEIDALEQARTVLIGARQPAAGKVGRRKKPHLSPEGRARIAEAGPEALGR